MLEFNGKYYSTKISNRQELMIDIFVLVDDFYREYAPTHIQNRKGVNRMKMSDSEIIAIAIFGEICSIDSERHLYSYCVQEFGTLFPNFCDRSRFHRIRKNLHQIIELLFNKLTEPGRHAAEQIIDSAPLPVCQFGRAHFHKSFVGHGATFGKCPSKKLTYFGYKIHLICTVDGFPTAYALTPANVDDRAVVPEILENSLVKPHFLFADKGYIGKDFCDMIRNTYHIRILPLPKNQASSFSSEDRRYIFSCRRRIETVFSQLSNQFKLQKVYAKSLWGLISRLHCKMLAFVFSVFLNIASDYINPFSTMHLAL